MQLSFELFPPNTFQGLKKLDQTINSLNQYSPEFYSVTFGSGGTNQKKSFGLVEELVHKNLKVVPHLSCIGLSKAQVRDILQHHIALGISHIVVIRGDIPEDKPFTTQEFKYANELVEFIRLETGDYFHITVAAYPEFHPEAENISTDLNNFKHKISCGANSAITQFFFSADAYWRFIESCQQYDINIPIIPGILPIDDYGKLLRFAKLCGADIPLWLHKRLHAFGDDKDAVRAYGIDVTTKLCQDLLANDAPGLHFYTLNKVEPTSNILNNVLDEGNDTNKPINQNIYQPQAASFGAARYQSAGQPW